MQHKREVEGKSLRVIAKEEGVVKRTIEKDLAAVGYQSPPEPTPMSEPANDPTEEPPPQPRKVTGADGKKTSAAETAKVSEVGRGRPKQDSRNNGTPIDQTATTPAPKGFGRDSDVAGAAVGVSGDSAERSPLCVPRSVVTFI